MSRKSLLALLALGALLPLWNAPSAQGIPQDPRNRTRSQTQATREPDRRPMSDQDIYNPKKLNLNVAVPFTDSFDNTELGSIFVTKRAAVGSADRKRGGYFGEPGSPRYRQRCLLFCPPGTKELDATYLYVVERDGECSIGVRAIGWKERDVEYTDSGRKIITTIAYNSTPTNIQQIGINDTVVSMTPEDKAQLKAPEGTNSKYFPRNKGGFFGMQTTTETSADLSAGYITNIHYFPATALVEAASPLSESVVISFPRSTWLPSKIVVEGDQLKEMKTVISKCDA